MSTKDISALGIPSQLKSKGSMCKSFEDFTSARIAIDATETFRHEQPVSGI